jgi:transcriptional regulator with XRE-family HTH domain
MSEDAISDLESRSIANLVRETMARQRLKRAALAEMAMISVSTLEKALSGQRPFTLATVVRLEQALAISLRKPQTIEIERIAPEELGSYARAAVRWVEGSYLTIRPSFGKPDAVYAYRTDIRWDAGLSHLVFGETARVDPEFAQSGNVSIPHQSGYIYLVTNRMGQYRLIVLSRPMIGGEMYGLLTTLHAGRGAQLLPVSTPIVLAPMAKAGADAQFGRIEADSAVYPRYRLLLRRALEEPFALLMSG